MFNLLRSSLSLDSKEPKEVTLKKLEDHAFASSIINIVVNAVIVLIICAVVALAGWIFNFGVNPVIYLFIALGYTIILFYQVHSKLVRERVAGSVSILALEQSKVNKELMNFVLLLRGEDEEETD